MKKAKVAKKVSKVGSLNALLVCLGVLVLAGGCSTSEPASRSTSARYEFGDIKVDNGSHFTLTLGDGAIASADSTGSTETMTANPTNDVKPDIDVSVPVNKAGAGQSVGSAIGDAVAGLLGLTDRKSSSAAPATDCAGGNCSEPTLACPNGNCSEVIK